MIWSKSVVLKIGGIAPWGQFWEANGWKKTMG